MRYQFVELVESLLQTEEQAAKPEPTCLVITKTAKYMRGHIIDHNVRINSDGRVRGRIVLLTEGQKREVDANDIGSLEIVKATIKT